MSKRPNAAQVFDSSDTDSQTLIPVQLTPLDFHLIKHTRVLIWLCMGLLLCNVMLVGMLGVGAVYTHRQFSRVADDVNSMADSVRAVTNTFANITSNFQLLPVNV